jgi:hypothetical protein
MHYISKFLIGNFVAAQCRQFAGFLIIVVVLINMQTKGAWAKLGIKPIGVSSTDHHT